MVIWVDGFKQFHILVLCFELPLKEMAAAKYTLRRMNHLDGDKERAHYIKIIYRLRSYQTHCGQ